MEEDDTIGEDCFGNILQTITQGSGRTSAHEDYELQYPHDQNVCVWCQSSIYRRRTYHLPDREREFIAEIISPRNVNMNVLYMKGVLSTYIKLFSYLIFCCRFLLVA